jgi:hypothetical protein
MFDGNVLLTSETIIALADIFGDPCYVIGDFIILIFKLMDVVLHVFMGLFSVFVWYFWLM